MTKKQFRTIFVSDIHLWNLKNQWDKLVEFLDSVLFENLVIIWDFIDYWQLSWFGKWWKKEAKTLDYINNLAKNWVKVTYLQWNHDRKLKCLDTVCVENMTIKRDMYYKTLKWKKYYVTHWDCMDWINRDGCSIWQVWSIFSWLLLKMEYLWNKNVYGISCISIVEKLDEIVKRLRMPESKIQKKIRKFGENLDCDWLILWHFHEARHYSVNWIDYFNTWDWLRICSAVVEDMSWNLELLYCKW